MNLLSSTSIFSFYTLISRMLGYIRDILIAIFLGASIYADAFFVAFVFPILLEDYLQKELLMQPLFQAILKKKLKVQKKKKILLMMSFYFNL